MALQPSLGGMDEHKLYTPMKPTKHLKNRARDDMATELPCDSFIIKTRKSPSYLVGQQ